MEEFLERYRRLSNDQLADLWQQAGKLTPEAQKALRTITDERDLEVLIEDPVTEEVLTGNEWATHSEQAGWLSTFYPGSDTQDIRSRLLDGRANEIVDYRQQEVGLRMVMAILLGMEAYYWVYTVYLHFVYYDRPYWIIPLLVSSLLFTTVYCIVQQPRWGLVTAAGYVGVLLGADVFSTVYGLVLTEQNDTSVTDLYYLADLGFTYSLQWVAAAVFVLTPYLPRALRIGYPIIIRWLMVGLVVGVGLTALYYLDELT